MKPTRSIARPPILLLTAGALLMAAALSTGAGERRSETETNPTAWVASMAALHAHEEPTPTPLAEAGPRVDVSGERVSYTDGVEGYLARPRESSGPLPGLVVIHEWWGLNDNIEAMTRRLAGEGYLALAVDLYGGKSAENSQEAMALMREVMSDRGPSEANLRAAYDYLERAGAPKIGTIGWCFGGAWSLATALLLPIEIDATVIYYGRLVTDAERLRTLEMPILGLFGAEDRGIPVSTVHQFEEELESLGKEVVIEIYEDADHAFANPSGQRYNPAAAEDAWDKTVSFLAQHLR